MSSAPAAPDETNRQGSPIVLPEGVKSIHHEVELGVIIGKRCKDVRERQAFDNVAGYCIALDMTARCWQDKAKKKGLPWTAAKGFDTSLPVGPFIPASLVADPMALTLWCNVNGVQRQRGCTGDMLFAIPELISRVSKVHTLEEGDLLLTGTPAGVGPVQAGDRIAIGIEELDSSVVFDVQ
jgi:acylpyruvate hydrolase